MRAFTRKSYPFAQRFGFSNFNEFLSESKGHHFDKRKQEKGGGEEEFVKESLVGFIKKISS
jgi:hypothetical protein